MEISSYWREDVALESILSPPDTVYVGDTIHPAVMGRNYGRDARSAYMWCIIDNGMVGVYASIQGVTPPTRDSFTVTFAVPWIAELPGKDYYVRFTFPTGPPRDSWPENDTIGKHFIVLPRDGGMGIEAEASIAPSLFEYVDIGFDTVLSPPDTVWIGERYFPCVRVVNYGVSPEYVYVRFTVADLGDSIIYSAIQGISIPGRDSVEVTYAFAFGDPPPGRYLLTWRHTKTDSNPSNDTISRIVHVLYPVGLASQQPGTQGSRAPLSVRPSIVRVGEMVSVSGLGPDSRAKLIDAAGRAKGHLAPGSTAIAAPCLPGVYFIKREEDDRTVRVLVQP